MDLLKVEYVTVKRYTESFVNGEAVTTLTDTFTIECTTMPMGISKTADDVAKTTVSENLAERTYDYKKLFTKTKISNKDVIVMNDGKKYKLIKFYDYSKFGTIAKHYEAVIVSIED